MILVQRIQEIYIFASEDQADAPAEVEHSKGAGENECSYQAEGIRLRGLPRYRSR